MHNLLVKNPENAQFIQPPIIIIGRTFVMLPFIISVIILGSKTQTSNHKLSGTYQYLPGTNYQDN